MTDEEKRKALERQARSLMMSREISPEDREKINSFMKNQEISPENRFSSIIRLLKDAPEKENLKIEDPEPEPPAKNIQKTVVKKPAGPSVRRKPLGGNGSRVPDVNGPTETKLYINDIYSKYKKYKLFKKRYLVERNNSLGFGLRKRLIPTRKFLNIMHCIHMYQDKLLMRIPSMLESILESDAIESPVEFNYLRAFRRWMLDMPFNTLNYDRIKWMEQWGFERELKSYVINFYSFLRIDLKERDKFFLVIENLLRQQPDLHKEEISETDERAVVVRKEKSNHKKEKQIFEYMGLMRSFMAVPGESDSLLARELNSKHGIFTFSDFLNMALEALVFQRPFTMHELNAYYEITTVIVSSERWDYSDEKLKQYGKDPASKKERRLKRLKDELKWYEAVYQMINIDDNGQNILQKSADDQWKIMDRVNRDSKDMVEKNFIVYVEAIVNYFRNIIRPFLNGETMVFTCGNTSVQGRLFSHTYFDSELKEMEILYNSIYQFRNNNPTLKITFQETEKIMKHRISSMTHVEKLLFKAGETFYNIARKLHETHYDHVSLKPDLQMLKESRIPLSAGSGENSERVIPFCDCLFSGFDEDNRLIQRIEGRRILTDSMRGGVFIFLMAYCYQAAALCYYPGIIEDISRRDKLKRELQVLKEGN